ncbi:hypothetical protein KDA_39440 [Dictyobacter alpinus]|uniref:Uncharacterized protein n=1 Tax=Dictyobacter alpinus TaxID=2014873 RepID=A0A402BB05_9CHLR|nr:hypothetical protein KDA_39440 [Dictyobacter alpinus]
MIHTQKPLLGNRKNSPQPQKEKKGVEKINPENTTFVIFLLSLDALHLLYEIVSETANNDASGKVSAVVTDLRRTFSSLSFYVEEGRRWQARSLYKISRNWPG